MECFIQVVLVAILSVLFFVWYNWNRLNNLPPGPVGIPFFGYALFLGKYPYITMRDIGKKYGNAYTLPMGSKSVLVLNDWASVKETLVDKAEVYAGRPQNDLVKSVLNYTDIIFSDGNGWKERRRFTLQHLRDFGFGKKSMEDVVMVEVEKIIERLRLQPVADIHEFFFFSFMNIVWSLVGDKSFDINDKEMLKFTKVMKILFKEFSNSNLIMFMPMLKYVPGISVQTTIDANNELHKFLDDEIDEHIKTYQKDHQRDIIDVYLHKIFTHQESKSDAKSFTRENLRGVMHNLFNAGIDTGSTTLSWALLYMISWPEIQRKVQDELDEVIGKVRLPTFSDRAHLPYTEAVIMEIHRYASIVPLSVPHSTTATTAFRNYVIPKDTCVLQNIWAVHHDPDLWGDPDVFRPERFLDENGQPRKPEYLIPFSVGSRYCLGEPLARMEIFLFFSTLLHKYSFSKPIGVPPPSFDPLVAVTIAPRPFTVIAKPR